jgi:hypothetical protein
MCGFLGRFSLLKLVAAVLPLAFVPSLRAEQQDVRAQSIVRKAVQTELAASRDDHSRWQYKDADHKPDGMTVFIVVETDHGSVKKAIERNGQPLSSDQLHAEDERISSFVKDPSQQARQRKDSEQDDRRAENMLRLLPDAFLWSVKSDSGDTITLHYVPDPAFNPPDMESRVFAAMAGEIVVNKEQNRIQTIKGKLIHDVKFGWGLLGRMDAGGVFNVERRELGPKVWQITESHVHINGKALLFKSIGEQDDEVKSDFKPVAGGTTLQQAANILRSEPTSLSAKK